MILFVFFDYIRVCKRCAKYKLLVLSLASFLAVILLFSDLKSHFDQKIVNYIKHIDILT